VSLEEHSGGVVGRRRNGCRHGHESGTGGHALLIDVTASCRFA
jgi:hypothetical protein